MVITIIGKRFFYRGLQDHGPEPRGLFSWKLHLRCPRHSPEVETSATISPDP